DGRLRRRRLAAERLGASDRAPRRPPRPRALGAAHLPLRRSHLHGGDPPRHARPHERRLRRLLRAHGGGAARRAGGGRAQPRPGGGPAARGDGRVSRIGRTRSRPPGRGTAPAGRLAALAASLACLAALPGGAPAQAPAPGPDYDLGNEGWNGLSVLDARARGMGFQVVQMSAIDWDALDRSDVVFFLYPTARIDPTHLDSFVRNGGRVLLADDFGETDAAHGRLGILRGGSDAAAASEFWDDQLFAPIARPLARHPLTDGVDSVTTNYPAVWRTTGAASPVIGFDDGSSVVAALVQGDGRLVALSDPSVLINRMLEFDGNLAFAINLLRWLGRDEQPRRLVVMTGDVMLFGEPSRMIGDGHPPGSMAGL